MKAKLNVVKIKFFITDNAITAECHAKPSIEGFFAYPVITHGVARLKAGETKNDIERAKRIAQKKAMRTAWRAYANYIQSKIDEITKNEIQTYGEFKSSARRMADKIDAEIVRMVNE